MPPKWSRTSTPGKKIENAKTYDSKLHGNYKQLHMKKDQSKLQIENLADSKLKEDVPPCGAPES